MRRLVVYGVAIVRIRSGDLFVIRGESFVHRLTFTYKIRKLQNARSKHAMCLKAKPLISSHGVSILLAIVSNLLMRTAEPSDAVTSGNWNVRLARL